MAIITLTVEQLIQLQVLLESEIDDDRKILATSSDVELRTYLHNEIRLNNSILESLDL